MYCRLHFISTQPLLVSEKNWISDIPKPPMKFPMRHTTMLYHNFEPQKVDWNSSSVTNSNCASKVCYKFSFHINLWQTDTRAIIPWSYGAICLLWTGLSSHFWTRVIWFYKFRHHVILASKSHIASTITYTMLGFPTWVTINHIFQVLQNTQTNFQNPYTHVQGLAFNGVNIHTISCDLIQMGMAAILLPICW